MACSDRSARPAISIRASITIAATTAGTASRLAPLRNSRPRSTRTAKTARLDYALKTKHSAGAQQHTAPKSIGHHQVSVAGSSANVRGLPCVGKVFHCFLVGACCHYPTDIKQVILFV